MDNFLRTLEDSLHKGFINQHYEKTDTYKPRLLVNNQQANESVLSSLVEELDNCHSFIFSVAFITESGLATLKSHLLDLKRKGIKGRILTSTFLNFNQPKVFKELLKVTNVEVRLTDIEGFHSKGYIFEHDRYYSLIVGSSNLTAQALKMNYEWNVKLTSYEDGEVIHHFKNQFEEVWEQAQPLTNAWIASYESVYKPIGFASAAKIIEHPGKYKINPLEQSLNIKPNKMQEAALKQIQAVRDAGYDKGLVISATGTGKTFLSAFDVRRFAPKRMLFIVHREQILRKAKDDFQKVMGGIHDDFGILSGTTKETDPKYLFTTIQTISKTDTLTQFAVDEFDYILIDEVHKAGAASYLKVLEYFNPKFLMGMTATPERTDDFNIYELFDYNIAYEIRLQEALEEDMLCPFHYFGVTDFEYNGEVISDATVLSRLVTEERIRHIMDKLHYYGHSGEDVKGLIFCSRKEEASQLSEAFNMKGLRTIALTGAHSQEERIHQIDRLENGALDYIITVDIFNEGIDIPSINQVVMLRQTQSSIIFIQQLGRGLRKHDSKEFVTIIDFIGNYKNNYMIPIALSGDKSQNKDNIRRQTKETSYIKGVSTVNFEEIARKQIFKSINASNLTAMKVFRDAYAELKNRLGRFPFLHDFINHHSLDPVVIVNKFKNHYEFLLKMKEDIGSINEYENQMLTMLSMELLNGKRAHELILFDLLITNQTLDSKDYKDALQKENCAVDEDTLDSVERVVNLSFFTETDQKKYGNKPIIIFRKGAYKFNPDIVDSLKGNILFRNLFADVIASGLERNKKYNPERKLTRYNKYSRKDACKLLNWHKDESATVFGYKTKHQTCPIFVTYHKNEEVEASVDYGDEFINPEVLKWESRNNRKISSPEIQKIVRARDLGISIHLFVKKSDDEDGSEFYYLGQALPDEDTVKQDTMPNDKGKMLPVVHMNMVMEKPIEHKLYQYIVQEND